MVVKIKEALFFITQTETGVVPAAGLAATWSDNYRYQVPQDRKYVFRPGHTFSASLWSAAAVYPDVNRVRIELRDAAENHRINILQDSRYAEITEFADRDLIRRLDIVEEVEATAGMWIVIMTLPAIALDPTHANSFFSLTCDIVIQTIM